MEIAVVGSLDFTLGFQLAGVLRLHNPVNLDELISTMKSLLNEVFKKVIKSNIVNMIKSEIT